MSAKDPVFQAIKTRRASRLFTQEAIAREHLIPMMESARWAPSAGNRRIHKFIVIEDQRTIQLVRSFSPGMLSHPTALIVICTDKDKAALEGVRLAADMSTWVDVGAAAQNIMLTAHELGLGTCPTTSFSHSGVSQALNLPSHLEPEYIVQIGYPLPETRVMRPGVSTKLTVDDITYWGAFEQEN